ncbi:MAG: Rieske 2Fe-2S domain-containing protein [Polyangiaceae bacterium]|nr:Rieske 2Fe-2S domain-containing protein [Polyangiaceae bacterium]
MKDLRIAEDIRDASTLPADIYRDPELYRQQVERVFARSWQLASWNDPTPERETAAPLTLLPRCLDEPLLVTHDASGTRHLLSNVCTHRGNMLVDTACTMRSIRCRYHGRRFGLDGRFAHMPEFEEARGFPSPTDDLPRVPSARLGPLLFAGIRPAQSFESWLGPLAERFAFVPWDRLKVDEERHYEVDAHWALYCDNYLEGFHIPFVHASLADGLDYGEYSTETFEWGSLQVGIGKEGEDLLDLPASHPDHGRNVAALYAFLFPSTMINVYGWGVSINAVQPLGPNRTRIVFLSLVSDASRRSRGVGADLHRVEMEDEAIVESVQRGVRSRLYHRGRFSPSREIGVHHFHRLLGRSMIDEER